MRWVVTLLRYALAVYVGFGIYLYLFQSRQVYFPDLPSREVDATPADLGLAYEALKLTTADGETLEAWYLPATGGGRTLLYLHGNGGNMGHRLDAMAMFHSLGLNVLIFDYRGYGDSTGKPDEDGTYQDALAAWRHLTLQRGISPDRIALYGESLGGSIAAWLAARHKPAALVLFASFTSVRDMAQQHFPFYPARLLVRYRYDTADSIARVSCPVLILHSVEDEIVPFSHAHALLSAAPEPKRLVELAGGHNDAPFVSRDVFVSSIGEFVASLD